MNITNPKCSHCLILTSLSFGRYHSWAAIVACQVDRLNAHVNSKNAYSDENGKMVIESCKLGHMHSVHKSVYSSIKMNVGTTMEKAVKLQVVKYVVYNTNKPTQDFKMKEGSLGLSSERSQFSHTV